MSKNLGNLHKICPTHLSCNMLRTFTACTTLVVRYATIHNGNIHNAITS